MANVIHLHLLFILLIQDIIFIVAQPIQHQSTDGLNLRSIPLLTTTSRTTISYEEHDDSFYGNENSGTDLYDEEGEEDSNGINSSPITNSHNMTAHLTHETPIDAYEDEVGPYQDDEEEEEEEDDDGNGDEHETEETPIYADPRFADRSEFRSPTLDSNLPKPTAFQTTSRMSFISNDLWTDLFSRPAILVGITGGIIIGMLSAILLVMFIIYRMRKKDEGSYVLEEAPRKSPSHAYTRVSSREFFA